MSLNDARTVRLIAPYPKLAAKCIGDCHMHFMSGRTTPLPLLWNQGLPGRRIIIEILVSTAGRIFKSRNIGRIQKKPINGTIKEPGIADMVVEQHNAFFHGDSATFHEYQQVEYWTFLVALMMDMEYATLEGYKKKPIYYRTTKDSYVYRKLLGNGKIEEKELPGNELKLYQKWVKKQYPDTIDAIKKYPWKYLGFFHYDPRRWNYGLEAPFDEENQTGPWNYPFSLLATPQQSGLFIGLKMYTPLGYQPDDPHLPYLDPFFAQCEAQGIPIIVHCSAGGMRTHDWKYYLDAEKNAEIKRHYLQLCAFYDEVNGVYQDDWQSQPVYLKDNLRKAVNAHSEAVDFLKKRDGIDAYDNDDFVTYLEYRYRDGEKLFDGRQEYFVDNFIHPRAWRKVLNKHPKLKICFAHFGGDEWQNGPYGYRKGLENVWIQELISILKDKKFENVYTDISYFNTHAGHTSYLTEFEKALDQFLFEEKLLLDKESEDRGRNILDRILWGTDWYLTEIDNLFYDDHCKKMKDCCDNDKLEGAFKTLYLRFTMVNPVEFFRLGEIAENFGKALSSDLSDRDTISKITAGTRKTQKIAEEAKKFRTWLNDR